MIGLLRAGPADRIAPAAGGPSRTVALVAAVMAFFAALALALALAAGRLAAQWSDDLGAAATLSVFAPGEAVEAQARAALNVLRTTPGIREVRLIEVEEQHALLEPWFGPELALDALPLPLLIEVRADRDRLDRASLELRLQAEAPGAVYDDHAAWRAPLVVTAERLRAFAFACLGLIALALAAVLSLAASAAIASSGEVIRTLRLVGARDRFVSAAFTRRLTLRAAAGAGVGTLAALGLIAALPPASEPGFFLVGLGLVGPEWLAPVLVPLAAAAVAFVATRLAARRTLRRFS